MLSTESTSVMARESASVTASVIAIELPSVGGSSRGSGGRSVASSELSVAAGELSVDAMVEELRVRREAIETADRAMEEEEQAQHLRMLQAFEFIGATDSSAELSLRALHDGEPKFALRKRRAKERASRGSGNPPTVVDPEANRHCAEFELWLGEEAHRAVLTSFQRKQPATRAAAGTRHSNRRYIGLVLVFVVGFPIYVAKDILQPSSIYPTITPDPKLLLEHFMVAQTNAYANSTCSPISPWSLAEDGIEIAIPPLYWILSAVQMLCYVAAIGMWYYTFLHRNVDFAVLRATLRSGSVRAMLLQLTLSLAHRIVQESVNAPLLGGWRAFNVANIVLYVAGIAIVILVDAAREKHPISRRFIFLCVLIVTAANVASYLFTITETEMVDFVAIFRQGDACAVGGRFIKPIMIADIKGNVNISLFFVLATAFRKVIKDPNKVCFVPFHFTLEEVEEMLAAKAHEDKHRPRKARCCSRKRPSAHVHPPGMNGGGQRHSLRERVSIGD